MIEAMYYTKLEDQKVRCQLCPNDCIIPEGKTSICMGRKNIKGQLMAINYGQIVSLSVDPVEKKPLYHFFPGTSILSTAGNSCNLHCRFCQNWKISQTTIPTTLLTPGQLIEIAQREKSSQIAYTYTEPLVWYEFVLESAILGRTNGLKNVLVTNGFIHPEPFEELLPYIDAMNIDLKALDDNFYRKECRGKLEPVLTTIKRAHGAGILVELTNLLITGLNDSPEQIQKLVDWVAHLSPEIPLHFSAYHPSYQMNEPKTDQKTLETAYQIGKKKLYHVYVGNMNIEGTGNTCCPSCQTIVIQRNWYKVQLIGLKNGHCLHCGAGLNIRMS